MAADVDGKVDDPVVKRMVLAVIILIALTVFGWMVSRWTSEQPVDLRWATFAEPVKVGVLTDDGQVSREVTAGSGVPVARDGLVDLTFNRCGPLSVVDVISQRTWVLSQRDRSFIGFEGDEIGVQIGASGVGPECQSFTLEYEIPADVKTEALADATTKTELRFTLTPNDPKLGPILITSEAFVLAEAFSPNLETAASVVPVGGQDG